MGKQPTQFDFWYAVNNTAVVVAPRRHLETFGNTLINYHMVSELMDNVGQVRVREGRMQAMRPQIVTPTAYSTMILDGFGEQAEKYLEWLREHEDQVRILQYGYTLRQESFSEQLITDNIDAVVERVKKDVGERNDPFSAVIRGVDDPWDVCLVRLFWQVIQNSVQANFREMAAKRMFEIQDGLPQGLRSEIETAFQAAGRDASRIKSLGRLLQQHNVFDQYQDRFFALVRGKG
ncbi:MAG: hypothetical protein WCI17_08455 [bacterium]